MPGVMINHNHPSASRFLLNAYRHVGAVYLRLSPDTTLHLGGAFAEPLHVLYLVFPILNSHEHTGGPIRVNTFLLFRRGKVPIAYPLPELASVKVF